MVLPLSGGQKARFIMFPCSVNDPSSGFPRRKLTTGLDPQSRGGHLGNLVRDPRRGNTFFLTTHLMEEAERVMRTAVAISSTAVSSDIDRAGETPRWTGHCPGRNIVLATD